MMSPNLSDTRQSAGDKAIARFAESMIQRMEEMKSESWKKGWLKSVHVVAHVCGGWL